MNRGKHIVMISKNCSGQSLLQATNRSWEKPPLGKTTNPDQRALRFGTDGAIKPVHPVVTGEAVSLA